MSKASQVKEGDRYGRLTVVRYLEPYEPPSGHRRSRVLVRCSCGKEYPLLTYNLTRGSSTRCRSCSYKERRSVRVGDKFDRLLVVGRETQAGRSVAKCLCDCGEVVFKRPSLLQQNQTNSCGCAPDGKWKGVGELSGTFIYRMKRNAQTRGIKFDVFTEDLWALFQSQKGLCALSGSPLVFGRGEEETTASLDRIDSHQGYCAGNLQWIHKDLNKMKWEFPQDHFIEMCKRVADFNSS